MDSDNRNLDTLKKSGFTIYWQGEDFRSHWRVIDFESLEGEKEVPFRAGLGYYAAEKIDGGIKETHHFSKFGVKDYIETVDRTQAKTWKKTRVILNKNGSVKKVKSWSGEKA